MIGARMCIVVGLLVSAVDSAAQTWTLVGPPLFSIDENSRVIIHRVSDRGAILDNGLAVVANWGSNQLVYLSERGEIVHLAGGKGGGPGEFDRLFRIYSDGRRVVATDFGRRRISTFSAEGQLASDVLANRVPTNRIVGVLIDGSFVLDAEPRRPPGFEVRGPDRAAVPIRIVSADGTIVNAFTEPPRAPSWTARAPRARINLGGTCLPQQTIAALGSTVFVAEGHELTAIQVNGTRRVIHRAADPPRVTRAMHERLAGVVVIMDSTRTVAEHIGRVGDPLPSAWMDILPDATGRLWLRVAECHTHPDPQRWEVVDTSGAFVARVEIPLRSRLIAARADRALIVRYDSLGVEHVELYRVGRN